MLSTLQKKTWCVARFDKTTQAMQSIKDAGVRGVVYFPDHDTTGYSKSKKMALAAAKVGLPFIQINPARLWAECPAKGDIADWVELEMTQEEFIRRLEEGVLVASEQKTGLIRITLIVGVTIILPKLKPCGLPLQRLKYQCFVNHSLPKFGDGHDHIAETTK